VNDFGSCGGMSEELLRQRAQSYFNKTSISTCGGCTVPTGNLEFFYGQ
jgi:hypothetical protein